MKRTLITLEDIAERANLSIALHNAAKGKHHRVQVSYFLQHVNTHLNRLSVRTTATDD